MGVVEAMVTAAGAMGSVKTSVVVVVEGVEAVVVMGVVSAGGSGR